MIANMMMYQCPQLIDAHDRYWGLIRQNLLEFDIESPAQLSQEAEEFYVWKHPELILSQTCGMPFRLWLHNIVELVGTPDFGLQGCPAGYYRSAILVRADDPRVKVESFSDAVFAYNQTFSQSGYAAPYWHLQPKGIWFDDKLHTGQHLESARAVAAGHADIAAIDAVSWRLISQSEAISDDLRILEWTEPTPGLPLIAAKGRNAANIFEAVRRAIERLDDEDRIALGLVGIVKIPKADYLEIQNPPRDS